MVCESSGAADHPASHPAPILTDYHDYIIRETVRIFFIDLKGIFYLPKRLTATIMATLTTPDPASFQTERTPELQLDLGVPAVAPEWLGANLVLTGLPDLTLLPAGARATK